MSRTYYKRNIFLFYVTRALFLPMFWLPIMYFFLTSVKHIDPFHATILLGLQEFLLIFLEVPTGVVADRISRKFSISLGYLLTSLPLAFFPIVNSFYIFAILLAIKAVGKALVSGADTSLLYDTLIEMGKTKEYKKIITRSKAYITGVFALCILIGGLLSNYGYLNWTFYLPVFFHLIAAYAAHLMVEPEVSKNAQKLQTKNYLTHAFKSAKYVIKDFNLIKLSIVYSILMGAIVNLKWFYPPIFEYIGFNLASTGMVIAFLYFARSMLNFIGIKLLNQDAYLNTLRWSIFSSVSLLIILLIFNVYGVVVGLLLFVLGMELSLNSIEELIHSRLETSTRASAMSFINLLTSVFATIIITIWGFFLGNGGVIYSIISLFMIFVIGVIFTIYSKNPTNK